MWSARSQVLWIIGVFSLLRIIEVAFLGLGADESYSVAVARDLHLSYFDHPPVHYWIVHGFAPLLGYGRASRLPFIALFAGSSWLLYRLTRTLFSAEAGVWAALAINLTGFFSVAAGAWVLPDGPLTFFLLAASNVLADYWFAAPGKPAHPLRAWILAGICIGLAALSKYQTALFCVGLAAFVFTVKDKRRELATPGPYLAAILTLAILSPVVIWNAQHHWASFVFQGARGAPHEGLHPWGPLVAILGNMALLLPWVFIPLAVETVRAMRTGRADERIWFCLMLALPTIGLFTLISLFGRQPLPHWAIPGWLLTFPLLGRACALASTAGKAWPRRWAIICAAILLSSAVLSEQEAATGWAQPAFPKLFKHGDPTQEAIEWTQVREILIQRGTLKPPGTFVASLKWSEAGKIDEALKGLAPVQVFSPDAREFGYRGDPRSFVGHDAVILARAGTLKERWPDVKSYFRSFTAESPINIGRQGRDEIEIDVLVGHDLLRPYPRTDQ